MNETLPARSSEAISLAEYARERREQLGLSQRQLATQLQVSHSSIARIENGTIHEPTPSLLRRLAEAFGVDPEDLYALAGYTVPHELPSFASYLRAKYNMNDQAAREMRDYFQYLTEKYRITERNLDRTGDDPRRRI
jgi:transcriptional regulator with XRE-family HTH domain